MSKAKELLLECKVKLGVKSDYALAKALDLNRGRVSEYMAEKEKPNAYACVRMALILKRDPIEIIAEIEAETAKNEGQKTFWRDFLQHAKQAAQRGMLALLCGLTLLGGMTPAGGGFSRSR